MRLKIITLACLATGVLTGCRDATPKATTPIRIGWQVAWATEGQLAQVLKHTDILNHHGLQGDFKGFSYGGPLNEAALAGEVDIIFTADQPAVSLIARDPKWRIIARLIDFRSCLVVPPNSTAKSTQDLRGKTIAIPFGSTTHRVVLSMLKDAGLNPESDVILKNLDILEQTAVAQSSTDGKWGQVDAMASWDPTVAVLESKKLARILEMRPALAVVVASEDFIQKNPEAVVKFLKAYRLAYAYYATHQEQANTWFADEAKIQFDPSLLNVAAGVERNMKATSVADIAVTLSDPEISQIQQGADFGLAQNLTKRAPNMRDAIDQSFLTSAVNSPDLMKLTDVTAH